LRTRHRYVSSFSGFDVMFSIHTLKTYTAALVVSSRLLDCIVMGKFMV